jgi:hypothetical protein
LAVPQLKQQIHCASSAFDSDPSQSPQATIPHRSRFEQMLDCETQACLTTSSGLQTVFEQMQQLSRGSRQMAPAQMRPDSGREFRERKGLAHVIIGP